MPDIREGLQHRDDFLAEVGGDKPLNIATFYRWARNGLPIVHLGRQPYVVVGPPYEFTARMWFASGMKAPTPPAPKPRRRRVPA